MLVAISVLFAPGLARAGEAYAAVPDHDMQMMEAGHCTSAPSGTDGKSSGKHDKSMAKSCCIAMCMAVAVAPSSPTDSRLPPRAMTGVALATSYIGYLAEIATPPPRLA